MILKSIGRHAAAIALLVSLAGCANSEPVSRAAVSLVESASLPEPGPQDGQRGNRPYYISPFDRLTVGVFGVEGLEEREVQVDSGGYVSFPLAGSLRAGGLTAAELQEALATRLTEAHVREPEVTVNLKESLGRTVTVEGQVSRAGAYPVIGDMTLLRAVALAGSTTEFAKLDDVIVFRDVSGVRYAGLYNLKAIRQGAYPDPQIYANDVIVVGDSPQRRLFKDLLQAVPLITTPLIYVFN